MLLSGSGAYDDAIRVLSDAITGVKGQSAVLPSAPSFSRDSVSGTRQLYKERQNYQAAISRSTS